MMLLLAVLEASKELNWAAEIETLIVFDKSPRYEGVFKVIWGFSPKEDPRSKSPLDVYKLFSEIVEELNELKELEVILEPETAADSKTKLDERLLRDESLKKVILLELKKLKKSSFKVALDSLANATEKEVLVGKLVLEEDIADLWVEVKLLKPLEVLTKITSSILLELTTVFKFVRAKPSKETRSLVPI